MFIYKGDDKVIKHIHETLNKIEDLLKTPEQKATEKAQQEKWMNDLFKGANPFGFNK